MENGLFAYILKYSKRQQIILLTMTVLSFPFYYLSLDLPKVIINDAISGTDFPVDVSLDILGFTVNFATLAQVPYLVFLCLAFLILVLINSGFKYFINIYRGTLGERMLRRMRLQLVERIMKFPLARFRSTSQGELVAMVNQETEPLGGFIGEALSLPSVSGRYVTDHTCLHVRAGLEAGCRCHCALPAASLDHSQAAEAGEPAQPGTNRPLAQSC